MNTELKNLTQVINSLIISDVLERSIGDSSNTEMLLSINQEFYSDCTTVDIRSYYKDAINLLINKKNYEIDCIDDTTMKSYIIESIHNNHKTFDKIIEFIEKSKSITVEKDNINKLLVDLILSNIINFDKEYQINYNILESINFIEDIKNDDNEYNIVLYSDVSSQEDCDEDYDINDNKIL